ncbi:MAG: phage major capsid protein [Anaerolineales bacterium]|nr:phage major capsid protein [Anaerolineales bacterium]
MKAKIKELYAEAGQLYERAKGLMTEYQGKAMPAEKSAELDQLLDQVEAKTAEAKRLERMAEMDTQLNAPANSLPAPAANTAPSDEQQKSAKSALAKFYRHGPAALTNDELKAVAQGGYSLQGTELKALAADEYTAGGALLVNTNRTELLTKQREVQAMRRIGRVLPPVAPGSVITPSQDSDLSDAEWTPEIKTGSDDTVKPFGGRVLTPHALAKRIKVSNTLLRTPTLDVEAWVRDGLAYKFAVPEENGFINGNGAQQPLGLKNTPSLPTFTTATSTQVYGDDIINWAYALPARYSPNARILCNRAFIRKVRALHTFASGAAASQYLWQPGLASGKPNQILDWPYELSDRFDDGLDASDAWEANAVIAVIGDFSYYWIVDSLNLSIQRLVELYAETNQTGFIGRKEVDGQAVLAEAFYALKVKS